VRTLLSVVVLLALAGASLKGAESKLPVLYSTDLLHPHDDPDDHYDLATLFSMPEFDIRGIVLDLGERQAQRTGQPAVEQMMSVTGRCVPTAVGLNRPLASRTDKALDAPPEFQHGVELILSVLRDSREPVTIFTTGSCRDLAVAFNREPALLREKVRALYCNVGSGPNEPQVEWNVKLDPAAYLRLFETDLPLYWCPCFGKDGYETYFVADQATVVGACAPPVQNFFVYCLTKSPAPPVEFLKTGPHPVPTGPRAMWCTAPLFHAAGRKIYQRSEADFVALQPADAERAGLAEKDVEVYRFVPIKTKLDVPATPRAAVVVPVPPPGELAGGYIGCPLDRVGTQQPQADGRPDCCVRVRGFAAGTELKNVIVTGPKEGRWELIETGRWWRLAVDRQAEHCDVFFGFWAAGEHRIEFVGADGSTQAVTAEVTEPAPAEFQVKFPSTGEQAHTFVFHQTDPRYKAVLATCLKNGLAGLGRDTGR
jgi:hypothetical protein